MAVTFAKILQNFVIHLQVVLEILNTGRTTLQQYERSLFDHT